MSYNGSWPHNRRETDMLRALLDAAGMLRAPRGGQAASLTAALSNNQARAVFRRGKEGVNYLITSQTLIGVVLFS